LQSNLKKTLEAKYEGHTLFVAFAGEQSIEEMASLIKKENITHIFSCIGMKNQEKLLVEIFDFLPEEQKVV